MIDNLKDAIIHCKEVAEMNRKEAEELRKYGEHVSPPNQPYNIPVKACLECATEHEQLAEWLTELQERREADRWIPVSERLPDPENAFTGCLVTIYETDRRNGEEFETVLPYSVGYDGETWNDIDGEVIPFEVIAWKYLPEPYKESEGEDA